MVLLAVMSHFLPLSGVSAVEQEWIPQLLPQYCHFGSPLEVPPPWFCSSTGTIKCHCPSTFCTFSKDEQRAEQCVCLLLSKCCVSPLQSVWVGSCQRWRWNIPMALSVTNYFPGFCLRDRYFSKTGIVTSITIEPPSFYCSSCTKAGTMAPPSGQTWQEHWALCSDDCCVCSAGLS